MCKRRVVAQRRCVWGCLHCVCVRRGGGEGGIGKPLLAVWFCPGHQAICVAQNISDPDRPTCLILTGGRFSQLMREYLPDWVQENFKPHTWIRHGYIGNPVAVPGREWRCGGGVCGVPCGSEGDFPPIFLLPPREFLKKLKGKKRQH